MIEELCSNVATLPRPLLQTMAGGVAGSVWRVARAPCVKHVQHPTHFMANYATAGQARGRWSGTHACADTDTAKHPAQKARVNAYLLRAPSDR